MLPYGKVFNNTIIRSFCKARDLKGHASSFNSRRTHYYRPSNSRDIFLIHFKGGKEILKMQFIYTNNNNNCTSIAKSGQKVNKTDDRRRRIRKFKESAWKCIYFLSAEVFTLAVTYNEPWFTNSKYFWVGPGDQVWPDQMYKFYTYSIFALIFWETRCSDFKSFNESSCCHCDSYHLIL